MRSPIPRPWSCTAISPSSRPESLPRPQAAEVPPRRLLMRTVWLALPVTIPVTWLHAPADAAAVPWTAWGAFLYLGLMSQYVGFFAWNAGLALGGVARVSQVQLLQSFVTLALASLLAGEARNTHVRIKGELADFPFDQPRATGIFRVSTQAQGVTLAYVPHSDVGANWPVLEGVDAELVFERGGMQIKDGHAKVLGYELTNVNGGIKDLHHGRVLQLDGAGRGLGTDLLHYVRASPLDDWLGHALSNACP